MNWEALAAIGELVGAFGVIASLGYLAIQIRQNTRQIRQNIQSFLGPFFHGIDSIFKLFEKGLVDPENWDNIVEGQLAMRSNPHMLAYIRSRPGPISKRFAAHVEKRLA